jgi:spermidine/putrescine transport system ATP-binding protein
MNDGLVQQIGTSREIYEHPANRFVADFIGETNFIDGKVTESGYTTTLEAAGVTFAGHSSVVLGKGTAATVAIRPEKIWLFAKNAEGSTDNGRIQLPGTIADAIYIGTDIRYQVELPTEDRIFVRVQNLGHEQVVNFQPGDQVSVQWATENAQVLTE